MLRKILVTTFTLILFMLVTVYGFSVAVQQLQGEFGGKPAETPPLSRIQSMMSSLTPTVTVWSITLSIITAASIVAYRAYTAGTRLLGTIKPGDFVKHVLVFGPTGSGKTSTAVGAAELALRRGSEIVVIDWKGEYPLYFSGATIVRKMDLLKPGVEHETYSLVLTDILRDVLELTEPMAYMLYEELSRGYKTFGDALTFSKLIKSVEVRRALALQARSFAEASIAEGLIRRLYLLALDEKRAITNTVGSKMVTIYDLSTLPTYQLRCLYAQIILWRLYNDVKNGRRPGRKPRLEKLLVLEESQNYVRPRRPERMPSIGERIVNELRGYGCGAVIISPDPTQIPLHMVRDAGAVVSIGYQALPEIIVELLSFCRYADARKLTKTTGRMRTYIYYRGRLYIKGLPKPLRKLVDLGVPTGEEATAVGEVRAESGRSIVKAAEPELTELKIEEEAGIEERATEGGEAKPVELVKEEAAQKSAAGEFEGPGSSRVDPSGGIPVQDCGWIHATAGAGQTRGNNGA